MMTVGVAMSGGVDSSVSTSLLLDKGYAVHGFFMKLPLPGVEKHLARVKAVAGKLDIPLTIVEMEERFTRQILDVFIDTYRRGCTPNPCILCNRQIKFGALRKHMQAMGMKKIATGHYARIGRNEAGDLALQRGLDTTKDQSYFLCRLTREQLGDMILPLGEKRKTEVYRMAGERGLDRLHGPESQDICFLAGRSLATFFQEQGLDENPGEIVTIEGRTVGHHRGLWHYTIGQRRGLGLPDTTPWYVLRLDAEHNRVVIGKGEELITCRMEVDDVHWIDEPPASAWEGLVQIRGRHRPAPARVEKTFGNRWLITFTVSQRAITPGQYAAFYENDLVCGSGVICGQNLTDPERGR